MSGNPVTTSPLPLAPDLDLRRPEYRREVFMRAYLHTLRHRSHPGGVYYLLPYLAEALHWTEEQKLWFAFLNGNTQHPVTSLLLMRRCPEGPLADTESMIRFFEAQWARLPFDTDRRHWKAKFPEAVRAYRTLITSSGSQAQLWGHARRRVWDGAWEQARSMYGFGRLSAFSYLEYLRIYGYGAPCTDLYLGDRDGSRSHRSGLEIVAGAPVEAVLSGNVPFDPARLGELSALAHSLTSEARERSEDHPDVGFFTLESALCTYKSWHKPNRRYPGVYNDMLYNRILRSIEDWPDEHSLHALFWNARRQALPGYLRLEDSPYDPGLHPAKQNHYRLTGQTVTLGIEDPELWSEFDQAVADHRFGVRADARRMVLR